MTHSDFALKIYEQVPHGWVLVFLSQTAKGFTLQFAKEQLQRQQTRDWQLSWAIVKAKAVSGETDSRWIDARYQIADCLTKHASRKSEAVLKKLLQEAQWRITAEEDMLDPTQTRTRDP